MNVLHDICQLLHQHLLLRCRWACTSLKSWLGYDDALNTFGCHGVGAFVGSCLLAAVAHPAYGGTQAGIVVSTQLVVQLFSGCAVVLWSMLGTFLVLAVTSAMCRGLRVSEDIESAGTDLELAEPNAYLAG
jgi:ammonium transporter, Amt family